MYVLLTISGLALIGACILSFIWIVLMRWLASLMVWTSILIVFLGTGAGLGYSGYRLYGAYMDTDPEAHKNIFQVLFYKVFQKYYFS